MTEYSIAVYQAALFLNQLLEKNAQYIIQ